MSVANTGVPRPPELPVRAETIRECPVRDVLDRVGDKWSVLLVGVLGTGTHRFRELHRAIEGISQRMLTRTLRGLERDGLVRRTVHATVPPRVDYALTDLGFTLLASVSSLESWARTHREDIIAARASYDASGDAGGGADRG